jgi:hypothetical protein
VRDFRPSMSAPGSNKRHPAIHSILVGAGEQPAAVSSEWGQGKSEINPMDQRLRLDVRGPQPRFKLDR